MGFVCAVVKRDAKGDNKSVARTLPITAETRIFDNVRIHSAEKLYTMPSFLRTVKKNGRQTMSFHRVINESMFL